MPVFNNNPADASAGFPVLDTGAHILILGEPKSFYRKKDDGDNYGVRFLAKVAEGPQKDKKVMVNCYQHNEDGKNFSKQVQMAALGFNPRQDELEFDAFATDLSWGFNTDDGSAGEGWQKMKGQAIIWNVEKQMDKDGNPQNKSKGYEPVKNVE